MPFPGDGHTVSERKWRDLLTEARFIDYRYAPDGYTYGEFCGIPIRCWLEEP